MQAIQLPLWGEPPAAATPISETALDVCPRQENNSTLNLDPCRGCPLREVCAPDDCGMKLYELDVNDPDTIDWEDWLSDPI